MKITHIAILSAQILLLASGAAQAQTDHVIPISHFMFAPMEMTVPAGSTVTWKNLDGEPHTVVSLDGAFRSQALDQDESFSFKFDKPGTYRYLCSIHPRMRATIIVK